MTPDQRRAEFDRLFTAIPGRNIDRLRKVAAILCCELNTIRIYRLKTDNAKAIPEAKLRILRRELEREGVVQPAEATAKA
jgi:hypothetical protein